MAARKKKSLAQKAAPKKKVAAKRPAVKAKVAAKKAPPKKKPAAKKAPATRAARRTATAPEAPQPAAPRRKASAPKVPHVGEAGAIAAAEIAAAVAGQTPLSAPEPSSPPPVAEVTTADGGHIRAPAPARQAEPEIPHGMPRPGELAPGFTLAGDDEAQVELAALRGHKVVLYFYPRDNTPGCTREAQEFSSLLPELEAQNAVVLGVSTDSTESHRKFKQTCELGVKLLADPERRAHEAYGTWREKTNYGRTYMGTQRATFLIDEDGRVQKVWPKVKVEDHALEVLNSLK